MPTTQSEDPNEKVDHPRHYNQHPSGIETIELIEHLPCNFANAVKYIWRCGLKQSDTPLRDLKSARWYTERERKRIELYDLDDEPLSKTEVVWRALARKVAEVDVAATNQWDSPLAMYLRALVAYYNSRRFKGQYFSDMITAIDKAIEELEAKGV